MSSEQPELFTDTTPETAHPGQGQCPLCHRPQMWRPRLQEWSRFCGSGQCNSPTRICQNCGTQFEVGVHGAGTKYCSAQCRYDKNFLYQQRNYAEVTCAWCSQRAKYRTRKRQGEYLCNECIEPIKHVWTRLEKHHVPIEMRHRLVWDPGCDICGTDVVTLTKIKGDSRPGAIDSVEALEQGAAYLRSHKTKMILRERERDGRS